MPFERNKTAWSLFLILFLSACGGGGGGSSDDDSDNDSDDDSYHVTSVQTGQVIDAPISNLRYRTATRSGVTDSSGRFTYLPGETVTFSIGNIDFPSVAGSSLLTPLDMVDSTDTTDEHVSNIIRFLQSVDEDGNTSNGISIPEAMHSAAVTNIDFERSEAAFETDTEVTSLMSSYSHNSGTLISSGTARSHFEGQLGTYSMQYGPAVGAWTEDSGSGNTNELSLYLFLQTGLYFHVQIDSDQPLLATNGLEFGQYAADNTNSVVYQTRNLYDENSTAGLTNSLTYAQATSTGTGNYITYVSPSNDALVLTTDVYSSGVSTSSSNASFTRISSLSSTIVGAWVQHRFNKTGITRRTENDTYAYVFLANNEYVKIDIDDDSHHNDLDGAEWGTYSWDSANQLITLTEFSGYNNDDDNSEIETYTITINSDTLKLTERDDDDDDDEVSVFIRQ